MKCKGPPPFAIPIAAPLATPFAILLAVLFAAAPAMAQEAAGPPDVPPDTALGDALPLDSTSVEFAKSTRYGALETGNLADGDGQLQAGEFRDLYSFTGKVGDPVVIELVSEDFDPYLAVVSPSGRVKRNDDWGRSSDARIQMFPS